MTAAKPNDQRDDEQLIQAINHGDTEAFEVLYHRYRDWVVNLAYRFTGHHDDALDVLQNTFTYFLGKFPGFVLTCALKTFLYPVVKHESLAIRRKARRVVVTDMGLENVLADGSGPGTSREDLAHVLRVLPQRQIEVIMMRFVDSLSLKEIAQALQIPIGTVKSRLHNAMATLRNDPVTKSFFEP